VKHRDAVALYWQVKSVTPGEPDEFAPDMWAELLEDADYADARACALAMLRRRVFVGPSEILEEVAKLRADRLKQCPPEALIPPPDLTPIQARDWLRDARRRAASGEVLELNPGRGELKARPSIPALTRGIDTA